MSDNEETGIFCSPTPPTPRGKRLSKTPTPKRKRVQTTDTVGNSDDEDDQQAWSTTAVVSSGKKKQRRRLAPVAIHKPIGRTYEECEDYDKMLHDWRDQGKDWETIRAKWSEMTGQDIGVSTLPNRYERLKSNFAVVKEEDLKILLACKRKIEDQLQEEKWDRVAARVEELGGDRYDGDVLLRAYKKLMLRHGITGPSEIERAQGVVDRDFD